MRKSRSLDASYFDSLYQAQPDPWGFETSTYERAKYQHTLEVICEEPVGRALEVGCSIGVFTEQLAAHCEHLVATELSQHAMAQAQGRCAHLPNIKFILAQNTADGVEGAFDLILLSEVIYFWDERDLRAMALALENQLQPGGRLVMVHWLGQTDYPHSADDAVAAMQTLIGAGFEVCLADRTKDYRMDVWRRRPDPHPTAKRS